MLNIKTKSTSQKWYEKNRQKVSERRKKRYAEDLQYREKQLEASRRYYKGERSAVPAGLISREEASKRIDTGRSTIAEWRRKKYYPEPKRHKGRVFFTENQVSLLKQIKHVLNHYKMRQTIMREELKKLRIFENWD